jgi:hypothetical protein
VVAQLVTSRVVLSSIELVSLKHWSVQHHTVAVKMFITQWFPSTDQTCDAPSHSTLQCDLIGLLSFLAHFPYFGKKKKKESRLMQSLCRLCIHPINF